MTGWLFRCSQKSLGRVWKSLEESGHPSIKALRDMGVPTYLSSSLTVVTGAICSAHINYFWFRFRWKCTSSLLRRRSWLGSRQYLENFTCSDFESEAIVLRKPTNEYFQYLFGPRDCPKIPQLVFIQDSTRYRKILRQHVRMAAWTKYYRTPKPR